MSEKKEEKKPPTVPDEIQKLSNKIKTEQNRSESLD